MKCDRFERMAALDLSGDLPPRAAARLRAHRACCPGCRAFAEELRASQGILHRYRSAVPSEALMEQMRRNVFAEVKRIGVSCSGWEKVSVMFRRPVTGIAVGLAACCVAAVVFWLTHSGQDAPGRVPVADLGYVPEGEPPAWMGPAPGPSAPAPGETLPAKSSHADGARSLRAGIRSSLGRPVLQPEAQMIDNGFRTPVPVLRRIELQTADPDIRIIWLVPEPGAAVLPARPSGG